MKLDVQKETRFDAYEIVCFEFDFDCRWAGLDICKRSKNLNSPHQVKVEFKTVVQSCGLCETILILNLHSGQNNQTSSTKKK